jgi:ribose 5-phosphate isomerase B
MKPLLVASDHAGFELKELVKKELERLKIVYKDIGTHTTDSVDYPKIGQKAAQLIARGTYNKGILVCGTGIGISIAANRNPKVRAALCTTPEMASLARRHNDANVLALGGRTTKPSIAKKIVKVWLETPFEGGRHLRRVKQMSKGVK